MVDLQGQEAAWDRVDGPGQETLVDVEGDSCSSALALLGSGFGGSEEVVIGEHCSVVFIFLCTFPEPGLIDGDEGWV